MHKNSLYSPHKNICSLAGKKASTERENGAFPYIENTHHIADNADRESRFLCYSFNSSNK